MAPDADTTIFPCPVCARKLKMGASLAGKKVRCPNCGQAIVTPRIKKETPRAQPIWHWLVPAMILIVLLWATFGLKLNNLDHTSLTRWDEVYHAVVAQNVMKHPLEPTLVDTPYLDYDHAKWGENHVWLHKPILPFWQTALFLALFGVNTIALRLPAAILSTLAALWTYLIGTELFDRRTALIAATLQAINPFIVMLVHGYQFADNIDIALLFWVEAGIYFLVRSLRTASWRDLLLAGLAQGLGFLCKSYLAGIIFGIALTAWLLPYCRLAPRESCRIGFVRLLALVGVTIATATPWTIYCMLAFPDEFAHEQAQVLRHLYTNVEGWGAPWDRVLFDYLIAINGVFYTPALVALFALFAKAIARRHAGLWLTYAWALGVVVPHVFAVTKTPSATLLAAPALLLLFGFLVSSATRGERWPLAALVGVLILNVAIPANIRNPGWGFSNWRAFGDVMRQAWWVIYHVAGGLGIATVLFGLATLARRWIASDGWAARIPRGIALAFCGLALAWLTYLTVASAWRVTERDVNDPYSVQVGDFARANLPDNAVLLCEERKGYEHLTIMFYADRTCYPWRSATQDETAQKVIAAGGDPFVVTYRFLPLPVVHTVDSGAKIYRWKAP